MKIGRILLLVVGSLISLVGFGLLGAGASVGWAAATQRDDAGFFTTSEARFSSDTHAITSDRIDLGDPGPDDWWADRELATVRVAADHPGSGELFVGIGAEADVEAYLAGVPHDEVVDVDFAPFSADYRRENATGTATPSPPTEATFWVAEASGAAPTITWDLEPGDWAIVVMNADASPNVTADIELGGRVEYLVPIAIGLGVAGVVLLMVGAVLIIGGVVGRNHTAQGEATDGTVPHTPGGTGVIEPAVGAAVAPVSPLRIEARIDPDLSRWKWLVKWILALPHFIVLLFLWVAFAVVTVVAFFAIVFTGRYPQSLFDFNVGVLRWSWRVGYYATSALGTDRYPPFTLDSADYPATLDVDRPERLSRGLVLVKSWLLAVPHLLVVAVFTATWNPRRRRRRLVRVRWRAARHAGRLRSDRLGGHGSLSVGAVPPDHGRQPMGVPRHRLRGVDDRRLPAVSSRPGRTRADVRSVRDRCATTRARRRVRAWRMTRWSPDSCRSTSRVSRLPCSRTRRLHESANQGRSALIDSGSACDAGTSPRDVRGSPRGLRGRTIASDPGDP